MGNARENSIGDLQGLLQGVIDSTNGQPGQRLSAFQSRPDLIGTNQQLGLPAMQNYLQGNYMRDLGQAGRSAGGAAAAYGGTNPYAFIQHAQAPVGDRYASLFANLPLNLFQTTTAGQGQNFQHLLSLLQAKGGLAGQREGSPMGGILGGLGAVGGSLLGGPIGGIVGSSIGSGLGGGGYTPGKSTPWEGF